MSNKMFKSINANEVASAKIRALVVEDSGINQRIHRKLLHNLGIENEVVGNGKETVDVHCSGKQFDLILMDMDMDMPIMNGIEATRTLRAMGIRSTIAGVSSHSQTETIQEFVKAGLDDYHFEALDHFEASFHCPEGQQQTCACLTSCGSQEEKRTSYMHVK